MEVSDLRSGSIEIWRMEVSDLGNGSIRSGEWKYQIWGMEVLRSEVEVLRSGEWKYQDPENGNADLRNRNLVKEIKGKTAEQK